MSGSCKTDRIPQCHSRHKSMEKGNPLHSTSNGSFGMFQFTKVFGNWCCGKRKSHREVNEFKFNFLKLREFYFFIWHIQERVETKYTVHKYIHRARSPVNEHFEYFIQFVGFLATTEHLDPFQIWPKHNLDQ